MNRAGLDMIDADSLEQVKGLCVYPLVTEEYREEFKAMVEGVFRGETRTLEFKVIGIKGRPVWLYSHAVPLRNEKGEITSLISATIDITERKETENRLRQSEARFRGAFENAAIGASMVNLKGEFIKVNSSLCEMLGYSEEELLSRTFSDVTHPDDVQIGLDAVKSMLSGEMTYSVFEKRYVRKGGELINVIISPALVRDSDENPLHFVALFQDITERKKAEEKIRAALREKEVLLQEVHHRVKNNMQVITSLLKLQAGYIDDKKTVEHFSESQNRIRAMALIHEKLYMSSDLANIDFGHYVKSLSRSLGRSMRDMARGVEVKIDIDGLTLNTDTAIPCGLIINELLTNCYKYAFPEGGGGEIRIALRREDTDELVLSVSDNGIGMPEGVDIRRPESLGLELVNLLAETQLRGRVELDTSEGTEFKVMFKELQHHKRV
jgi:PAS domain S-box-containing protein